MAVFFTVAVLLLIGVVIEDRWSSRRAERRAGTVPTKPAVTVVSLTALATQIERLHVLNRAGLLSDPDLKVAELALLETVPEI